MFYFFYFITYTAFVLKHIYKGIIMTQNLLQNTRITDLIFNIFDTESTGNNSFRKDEPIELAYLLFNYNKGVTKHFQTMIETNLVIHPAAIMTHGITNTILDNMEKTTYSNAVATVSPDFINTVHVAHNISFDYSMIPEIKTDDSLSLDTLDLARKLYKIGDLNEDGMPLTSHKMQEIRYWLKVDVDTMGFEAHRALADILVTAAVFKKMLDKFFELTRDTEATYSDLCNFLIPTPELIEICPFKKFEGKTFKEAVEQCLRNGDNYFDWLLGKLKDDPKKNQDTIYTINHWFKEFGYNPELSFKNKKEAANFFKKD